MIRKRISYNLRMFVVVAAAGLSLLPIVFIFMNSLMSSLEVASRYTSVINIYNMMGVTDGRMHYVEMTLLPDLLTLSSWRQILLENPTYLRFVWNSLILVVPIVIGQLVISPLAAFGFERLRTRQKEKLFFAYIITMLLPMQALLVPHFIAANILGINGNYLAIILPAVFAPFGIFLIRQQMKGFPKEVIEAASVDGASEMKVFYRVVLPNLKPTLIALTVLTFAEAWNIVDQAIVFVREERQMPLSVYLSATFSGDMGIVFALSTLFMIPALIVFIYGQDHLADGINQSAPR